MATRSRTLPLSAQHRSPAGFMPWGLVAEGLEFCARTGTLVWAHAQRDPCVAMCHVAASATLADQAPPRFLSPAFVEAALHTAPPPLTAEMLDVLPSMHLMIPRGGLLDDEGASVGALTLLLGQRKGQWWKERVGGTWINRWRGEEAWRLGTAPQVCWVSFTPWRDQPLATYVRQLTKEVPSYYGHVYLDPALEEETSAAPLRLGPDDDEEEFLAFGKRAERVILSALAACVYEPELVTSEPGTATRGAGFGKAAQQAAAPVWIGYRFKPATSGGSGTGTGSSTSKRPHWRRGHWRHVVHGSGRTGRRLQWIRPVFVNAAAGQLQEVER